MPITPKRGSLFACRFTFWPLPSEGSTTRPFRFVMPGAISAHGLPKDRSEIAFEARAALYAALYVFLAFCSRDNDAWPPVSRFERSRQFRQPASLQDVSSDSVH
jgi:hypothetical protein